jgi:hypothetical protein
VIWGFIASNRSKISVMKRRIGYAIIPVGALLAIGSYLARWSSFIIVNGHYLETWILLSGIGVLLTIFGGIMARHTV